jgi:hypothetical protein
MNTNTAKFTNAIDALPFILGGKATVTAVSQKTGVRYTYKITKAPDKATLFFVKVLTGSDNENSYSYIGCVKLHPQEGATFGLTAASKMTADALPVKGFSYILNALKNMEMPFMVELWHSGKCGRCGRKLTVPSSIASGFGPECAKAA